MKLQVSTYERVSAQHTDFNPDYAMTTNPDEPVILATLADASGEPTPLLIDGYALPVTVRHYGAPHRGSWPPPTLASYDL